MLEPIQGEGGVRVPSDDYLKKVREICDFHGLLLILDEVQTGMGRTGRLFAYEHYDVIPDIVTLAKGLGAGIPIGALLTKDEIAKAFTPGSHASTFGGNPVSCQAGIATLEAILEDGFILDNVVRMGKYFMERLEELKSSFPDLVVSIRGKGLLIGMEMLKDCSVIVDKCLEKGLLVNCTSGNVLRFTPPLNIQKKDIDQCIEILEEVLSKGI